MANGTDPWHMLSMTPVCNLASAVGRVLAWALLWGHALLGAPDPQTPSPVATRRCLLALLRRSLTPQQREASPRVAFQVVRLKDGDHVKRRTAAPGVWAWVLSTSPATRGCATLLGVPGRPRSRVPVTLGLLCSRAELGVTEQEGCLDRLAPR